ncbi:hypothetical protein A8E97_27420 [Burkholderia cenocepacia]|nr:hypothetical protein A8E94_22180 [Burkholderia cenocepacia]ONW61678.1 hypothetical protein A8E97_27420 [Burkholderia cenocepacia]
MPVILNRLRAWSAEQISRHRGDATVVHKASHRFDPVARGLDTFQADPGLRTHPVHQLRQHLFCCSIELISHDALS